MILHQAHLREINLLPKNNRGQALVQVLISVGIMGILLMVFAAMTENQSKEIRALSEKLASMDLEKLLIASLADGTVCSYVLNNPTVLTFNAKKVASGSTEIIALPSSANKPAALYTSIAPGSPPKVGPVAVQVGSPVSAISNAKAASIQLQITSGSNGRYYGNWLVNFDSQSLVRAIKPVSVSTMLVVDDVTSPTSATITACQGIGGGVGPYNELSFTFPGGAGGWVNMKNLPTSEGYTDPSKTLWSDSKILIPQGNRLSISVFLPVRMYTNNINQNLAILGKIHLKPTKGPEIVQSISSFSAIAQSLNTTINVGGTNYAVVPVNSITPGEKYSVSLEMSAYCNVNCSNAATAQLGPWSSAYIGVQEYY